MATPGDMLSALWDVVMPPDEFENTVIVNYVAPIDANEADVNGQYRPFGAAGGRPQIYLFRPTESLPTVRHRPDPTQPEEDACTLAHEYGHHLSRLGGHRPAGYEPAVDTPLVDWPNLTGDQKSFIFDEEDRAWQLGRDVLARLGCDDWTMYDQRTRDGLSKYRELLGLPR
jgi:hypothetical protein